MARALLLLLLLLAANPGAGAPDASSPLVPRAFKWFPPGHVKPKGWLLQQAQIQADTLCGHLEYFFVNQSQWQNDLPGRIAPFNQAKNLETVPYWLTGVIPLAVQLNDSRLLDVAHDYVTSVLDRQAADGWLGPVNTSNDATMSPWPRYRMLSALAMYADAFPAQRSRVIGAMHKSVHALGRHLNASTPDKIKYSYAWAHARWFELVANVQYLVDDDASDAHGDQAQLLGVAGLARERGLDWQGWYTARECTSANDTKCFPCQDTHSKLCAVDAAEEYFCEHGVNVAQSLKVWAVDYRTSKDKGLGGASWDSLRRMDRCHGQPGSVFSAHEVLDGTEPNRGTETCHVVEAAHSYAELFAHFGGVEYLDRVEQAVFNRLPAPYLNGSMWALQYFHETNSVGGCNTYGLPFECCVANGNQGWPRFINHLFATHADGGLVAALFAPAAADVVLRGAAGAGGGGGRGGEANAVHVDLETQYPFSGNVTFRVDAEQGFVLHIRVPRWANGATVAVGAGAAPSPAANGTLHAASVPAGKSVVSLVLPMHVRLEKSAASSGHGLTVHAGPVHRRETRSERGVIFLISTASPHARRGPHGRAPCVPRSERHRLGRHS